MQDFLQFEPGDVIVLEQQINQPLELWVEGSLSLKSKPVRCRAAGPSNVCGKGKSRMSDVFIAGGN